MSTCTGTTVVRRNTMKLRCATMGTDPDFVLRAAQDCDDQVYALYTHPLCERSLSNTTRDRLRRQCVELSAAHDRVRLARSARRS